LAERPHHQKGFAAQLLRTVSRPHAEVICADFQMVGLLRRLLLTPMSARGISHSSLEHVVSRNATAF
jgi:hypothetical protein